MSEPQHMQALARANHCRLSRAQLKREIKSGEARVSEVLASPIPDWLERLTVEELLRSCPFIRATRACRMLAKVPIGPTRTVGETTRRQRLILAGLLREWEQGHRRAA